MHETLPHVVGDSGFIRRVQHRTVKLLNVNARLQPGGELVMNSITGLEHLIHCIKHVKVNNTGGSQPPAIGFPGNARRREAMRIVGIGAVAVHVDPRSARFDLNLAGIGKVLELAERVDPSGSVAMV